MSEDLDPAYSLGECVYIRGQCLGEFLEIPQDSVGAIMTRQAERLIIGFNY